jgi:ATP-binding cassette subfamily C protein CydD
VQDSSTDAGGIAGDAPGIRESVLQVEPADAANPGDLVVDGLRVRELPPVSFAAEPGTITLIEGPSGAGKSSLLAALRGAADFDGAAAFGGHDLRGLSPAAWLAWAGQTPGLMRGTVAENIALGDAAPDADRIREALDDACAEGIDPALELGVQGSGLSGGQAQRVAVARALNRQSSYPRRMLALDEPSSALDPDTEARLWRSLRARADAGAMILLVSHRRTAREIADHVVTLGVNA